MQQFSDKVHWYFSELTSRVVAESGISTDREHLGKILLRSFKDAPDLISQIDGGTGEEETNKSVLERTILCASSFRNFGLKYQDVVVVIAPNHLHISIPLYAAFCIGVNLAGLDITLGENELAETFKYCQPKMVLCQSSKVETVRQALAQINETAEIIIFDKGSECINFTEFIHKYGADSTIENFKASDFDPENTNAILVSTTGSTGLPKLVGLTHRNICVGFINNGISFSKFPTPFNIGLVISPIQWISSLFQIIMSPIMRYTRLQTSAPITQDHVYYLINKYRPEYSLLSPTYLTTLLKRGQREKCDFTSFKYMAIGGSVVSKELFENLKSASPSIVINVVYGMTEASAVIFNSSNVPLGSIGKPLGFVELKLVHTITEEGIVEPNQPGELRLKGPSIIKGYYNNPELTAAAFDKDGWFKTGDILYRDEHFNFFFVDRVKMLIKYKSHQVSPVEIENVILKHPGVFDVVVTGRPDAECGVLPVAFVMKNEGPDVSSQDIIDLPEYSLLSPTYLTTLLKRGQREKCDFTSFKYMAIGGSVVSKELFENLKSASPSIVINVVYGMTEASAVIFNSSNVPLGSIGKPLGFVELKLVHTITEEGIVEPNQPGELRLKGPSIIKGYYNNPELTAAAFDKDGWFKTGDILYRDEHFNFFFVDRVKMLIKYKSHQVSPVEIENVILKHPGVFDVVVTGRPDAECGVLPVAFVMKNEGPDVSSQDIIDLVKESLTDSKQLRGGVVFLNALPLTSTSKVDRAKLKKMAVNLKEDIEKQQAE